MIKNSEVVLEFFKWYGDPKRWDDDCRGLIKLEDGALDGGNIMVNYRDYEPSPDGYSAPPIPLPDGILYLSVNCSDTFDWGSADAEDITVDNFPLFVQTVDEIEPLVDEIPSGISDEQYERYLYSLRSTVADLFAARVRKMRPQGACYSRYPVATWFLFDECGPERLTGFGNPYKRKDGWW